MVIIEAAHLQLEKRNVRKGNRALRWIRIIAGIMKLEAALLRNLVKWGLSMQML